MFRLCSTVIVTCAIVTGVFLCCYIVSQKCVQCNTNLHALLTYQNLVTGWKKTRKQYGLDSVLYGQWTCILFLTGTSAQKPKSLAGYPVLWIFTALQTKFEVVYRSHHTVSWLFCMVGLFDLCYWVCGANYCRSCWTYFNEPLYSVLKPREKILMSGGHEVKYNLTLQ